MPASTPSAPSRIRRRASIRVVDRIKVATFMGTDRPHVLRQAIHCCRNFGTVSIVGVYGGFLDKIPMGSAINRGLTFRMAQTPVQHYLPKLLERIEKGEIDPSFVITHRATLEEGPELYKTFRDKKDGCIKVVLKPVSEQESQSWQEQIGLSPSSPAHRPASASNSPKCAATKAMI